MKVQVLFVRNSDTRFFSVQIDRKYLRFRDNKAVVELEKGSYYITWIVRGKPGDHYALKMEQPRQETIVNRNLNGTKGGGIHKIQI